MSFGAALGGMAVQAGLDYFNTQAANNASRAAANRQMNFQKEMSNTAHRREVADLRAAGLNPILSANAGASTPGGASYTAQKSDSGDFDIDPMLASNMKQSKATVANTIADTGLKAANTLNAEKQLEIADEQKSLIRAQATKEGQLARSASQQANLLDKYGEASQVMGLINSGTGSIGNLMGFGGIGKILGPLFQGKNKNVIRENYSPKGEHTGTTSTRIFHD